MQNLGEPLNRYSPNIGKTSKYPIVNHVSTKKLSEPLKAFVHQLSAIYIPTKVVEALKDPKWVQAIKEEMKDFEKNHTWTLKSFPQGKMIVRYRWVFIIKHNANGFIKRYKARLVVKGYLKFELGKRLMFSKHGHLNIDGYSNADRQGSVTDRRSISGYFTFVGVKSSETIKDLKALLCQKYGFAENHQELFLGGDMLMDYQSLVDCGVQRDSTVHLVLQNTVGIKLFVKLPSSQGTIEIEAKAHDTIRNIKAMIQAKEMIPSDQFTLVYGGELLEEDSTLASLGFKSESTLQMIYAPKNTLSISVKAPSRETETQVFDGRRTLTIDVKQSDVVEDVKVKVFRKLKVSMKRYYCCRLLFGGKRLRNGRDLASYNIQKDSTLSFVMSANIF
ncbi:PREDICTED: polyubiquitin 11-like [Prunus mume]|uniref:Polyubiquitin 11-like n=1 Tax=Prunus mume TaxID=102107 RepID=A0ABM0NGI0_PRUMU|nr:PREDICTED: polyubiquitin 11-like [Prunus mume]